MKIKPVMFLLALQLFNAAPWALADEEQVIVRIPVAGDPLPQSSLSNVIWEANTTK